MAEETFDDKEKQFNHLWDGVVPSTISECKECEKTWKTFDSYNCETEKCGRKDKKAEMSGNNRNKSLKFRQYILEHVRQMKKPLNRENAFKYWMGVLKAEAKDSGNF